MRTSGSRPKPVAQTTEIQLIVGRGSKEKGATGSLKNSVQLGGADEKNTAIKRIIARRTDRSRRAADRYAA